LLAALAMGCFFFSIYGYYSYSFYVGSFFITKQVHNLNDESVYTGGDIISCFLGVIYGIMSLGTASPNFKAITEGKVAGKLAYEIIDRLPKILLDDPKSQIIDKIKGKIEFRNVTFSYPTKQDQKILKNFSCTIEPGKTTAIVGSSGSGKSTLIQLIERFYDPEEGEVFIDGINMKDINLRSFRRKVGYVGQEPVLFNMTIKDNLLFGEPSATEDDIYQALKSANAFKFVN
jgi:ATP-binding cassette subfamily B (MDR/TAP) protein 1